MRARVVTQLFYNTYLTLRNTTHDQVLVRLAIDFNVFNYYGAVRTKPYYIHWSLGRKEVLV